jgi:hypothetical protein
VELEFVIFTALLLILSIACFFFAVKFLFSFPHKEIRLFATRDKEPNNQNDISQKKATQETDSKAESEGVVFRPSDILPDYPTDSSKEASNNQSIGDKPLSHDTQIIGRPDQGVQL